MEPLSKEDIEFITESIRGALVEIELCEDISQGVEDDLLMSLELLTETVNNNV